MFPTFLALLLVFASGLSLQAQAPAAQPQDPYMSLMMSQPKFELATQVTATASFDPPVVRPGEQAIYRVTINALEQLIEWPEAIAAPPKLEMHPGAHGQILQMVGGKFEPRTAFNYRARASGLGEFIVPLFMVKVDGQEVAVPPAELEVETTPLASVPPAPQLVLEIPATNAFVGQAVKVNVLLPASSDGSLLLPAQSPAVQLTGQGFIVDQSALRSRTEVRPRPSDGRSVPTVIFDVILTPITAGKISAFAQCFVGNRLFGAITLRGPVTVPGGAPQYILLESEPVQLVARPLPREGELPGFTGAIGSYAVDPPNVDTADLRVGDPVTLSITVHGDGNLARLVAPPPPRTKDWQIFAPTDRSAAAAAPSPPPAPGAAPIQKVALTYTLIPLTQKVRATPAIPFSCFDPKRAAYVDLTVPPVPVKVQPGASPAELSALLARGAAEAEPEKEPVLSGLAAAAGRSSNSLLPLQERPWFPLVQLFPAGAILWLWAWDRRRRYLEQHPDILLRRRARRALRREWRAVREAARAGDAPGYAAAAVSAMRVACAPHYPAEPRALVGGDVLQVLPAGGSPTNGGRAGEVVRRFFSVSDASRFATAAADAAQLLPLQPELERVLEQLEEKLVGRPNDE